MSAQSHGFNLKRLFACKGYVCQARWGYLSSSQCACRTQRRHQFIKNCGCSTDESGHRGSTSSYLMTVRPLRAEAACLLQMGVSEVVGPVETKVHQSKSLGYK